MSETLPSLTANGQKLIDRLLTLPQGYLSADAEDGEIRRTVELAQGDVVDFGTVTMCQSASISGAVRIDDDGDVFDGVESRESLPCVIRVPRGVDDVKAYGRKVGKRRVHMHDGGS